MKNIIITSLFALSLFNAHYSSAVCKTLDFKMFPVKMFTVSDLIVWVNFDIDLEPDVTTTHDICSSI
jgi:hypothetical protein